MKLIENEINFSQYYWVLLKHRWAILTFFCVVVVTISIYSFTVAPKYNASTRIIIEKENQNIVDFKEIYSIDSASQGFYMTQHKILESKYLIKKVIETLKLWDYYDSGEGSLLDSSLNEDERQRRTQKVVENFQKNLRITPIRNTRIVEISFKSKNPKMAADVANSLVKAYMLYSLEGKMQANIGATNFLNEKIKEQRDKLKDSEQLLMNYKESNNIVSLEREEESVGAKLSKLSTKLIEAEQERLTANENYRYARITLKSEEGGRAIPEIIKNNFINKLKMDEANLLKELSDVSSKYGKKHPHVITLNKKLSDLNEKIIHEINLIIKSLENKYKMAMANEEALIDAVDKVKKESLGISKHTLAYSVLSRDVQANKQMYEILLTRLKETGITAGIESTNVRVLDVADIPKTATSPNKKKNILLAIFLGFFGGISLAMLIEMIDNTIETPDDVERYIDMPILGLVPNHQTVENNGNDKGVLDKLVTCSDPKSNAAEAYRALRTSLVFSASAEKKLLLVTSSKPSEGKSLTSSNLAVTLAQNGAKTLLIDLDFRRPVLNKIFKFSQEKGFSNLLVGANKLDEIIHSTEVKNLDIIACGHIPPNPAELLSTESMREYFDILKEKYDRIILDSPPIMSATDPVILSTLVDEVVLVIKSGGTSREIVRSALKKISQVNANILGVVLNDVKVESTEYYYSAYEKTPY